MPDFIPKPARLRGHRVRYEDVYTENPDLPEWLQDSVEEELVTASPRTKALLVNCDTKVRRACLGDWILQRPDQSLLVVTAERLATDYDLVQI